MAKTGSLRPITCLVDFRGDERRFLTCGRKACGAPGCSRIAACATRRWPYEVFNFFFRDKRVKRGSTVAEFWGASQEAEEQSMVVGTRTATKEKKAA